MLNNDILAVNLLTACAIALTIGFFTLLFIAANSPKRIRKFYYLTSLVPFFGAISYWLMAFGIGIVKVDGEEVLVIRYIDWLFTTPILLYVLSSISFSKIDDKAKKLRLQLVIFDILMVMLGIIATLLAAGFWRYIFFGLSTLFFLALVYYLTIEFIRPQGDNLKIVKLRRNLAALTIISWFFYPFIWLLSDSSVNMLNPTAEIGAYMILDFFAKFGFASILAFSSKALLESTVELKSS